jgi:endoglucanase
MKTTNQLFILIAFFCLFIHPAFGQTPVEKYGQLSVKGNRIVDKNGNPVELRGMSFYWSQWIGKFYNVDCVKWLRDDWCIDVVRLPMAVGSGGLATNPNEKLKIFAVVDAAIQLGVYVIVDFHDSNANNYLSLSQSFFNELSLKYKDVPNIMYEPWNEPLNVSWATTIKPYHQTIVSVIRKNDPDNIIICGTRSWSQQVAEAASDPVNGINIAYTLHFYAASHKQWLRDLAQSAMDKGAALFVTEYGTCEASGNGVLDATETQTWWDFLDKNYIGHCNWSVADISETSAILKPNSGVSANGGWTADQLKPSGVLVRNHYTSKCNTTIPSNPTPTVSLGAPANNSAFCAGSAITFTASATVPTGSVSKVDFYDGNTLLGTDNSAPYSFLWINPSVGTHTIKAISTSAANVPSSPATAFITVNASPEVTITAPANNTTITMGTMVINANVTGAGINNVQFYNGANLLGQDVSSPYSFNWSNITNGTHTLYVKATNASNCMDTATVKVSVNLVNGWTEEEVSNGAVCLFPNPFTQSFTIQFPVSFDYVLYDLTGVEVEKGKGEKAVLIGQNLPTGTYILKIRSTTQTSSIKVTKL